MNKILTFSSSLLEQIINFFKGYYADSLVRLVFDLVIILGLIGFILFFMWKFTHKKWLIYSLIFFVALFVVIVIADLKIAFTLYKYVVLLYFFVWGLYFIPNIRNLFEGLTKPKNNKNFVINEEAQNELIKTLIDTVTHLSERQVGAIITIEKEDSLNTYIGKGTTLDSEVTRELLETIFMPGTALHDGAVIIRENRIMCAGAFYPTSETGSIPKTYGSRHRAALGISEKSDAFTIVVSEETGNIAVTFDGTLTEKVSLDGLKVFLKQNIIVK